MSGVVVAGAGSVFSREDNQVPLIPICAPPASKQEIALFNQSCFASLPRLELPSSANELLVTADGIWANGQFYSHRDLMEQSTFSKELTEVALANSEFLSSQPYYGAIPPLRVGIEQPLFPQPLDMPMNNEPMIWNQPGQSMSFVVNGKDCHGMVSWINGIRNTLQDSQDSAKYIQKLSGGFTVCGVYNCTHFPLDLLEAGVLNYAGYSPNTALLLQNDWKKFHELNKDYPNAKLLQVCHSQGAIHVRNALEGLPPEIQDRIIVVAIAPAAVVPKKLCFASYNYVSENDFVYKLEPTPDALRLEESMIPNYVKRTHEELIILPPHLGVSGMDHEFQSPTYRDELEKKLADYRAHRGEYLPQERGK